jgi:hypothetical protein
MRKGWLALFATVLLVACGGTAPTATPTALEAVVGPTFTPNHVPLGSEPTPTPIPPVTLIPTEVPPTLTATPAVSAEVRVEMRSFAFLFDPADIPTGQPFAFEATNTGNQAHELALLKIDVEVESILALLQDGSVRLDQIPSGVTLISRTGPVAAGEVATLGITGLVTGRYALASLMPDEYDPDYVLQVFKGMIAEFSVR